VYTVSPLLFQPSLRWPDLRKNQLPYLNVPAMARRVRPAGAVILPEDGSCHLSPWACYESAFGGVNAALGLKDIRVAEWNWTVAETGE